MVAYEGNEPFVFISYAHKDRNLVLPIIEGLQNRGFRVWYDQGIEVGNEWPDFIAEHLEKCCGMVAFVSQNYGESNNCREELGFAKELEKTILVIYLEDPKKLRAGVRMRLSTLHYMNLNDYSDNAQLLNELGKAKALKPCLEKVVVPAKSAEFQTGEQNNQSVAVDKKKENVRTVVYDLTSMKYGMLDAAAKAKPVEANVEELYRQAEAHRIKAEYAAAFSLYKKAAEKGYAPAQYALGSFYELGKFVKTNKAEARKWYQKAADQGEKKAEYRLNWM